MTELDRAIRKATTDDINAILAFDQESANEVRKQFLQRAVDCGDAYVVAQDGSVVGVGVLEYTFFEHGFISLVYVDQFLIRDPAARVSNAVV